MENKNTQEKRKVRINVVDVVIILLMLAVIVSLAVRVANVGGRSSTSDMEKYDIYFSVKDIAYTSEDAFVTGDTVVLSDNGTVLGEFVGLETIMPAEFIARDKSGNLISVSYPEGTRIDVTGKIVSQGVMSDNGYLVGGTTYVAPGKGYEVHTEHMDFVLEITNIVEN